MGGWLTIRYRPSTSSPSLDSACMLSRVAPSEDPSLHRPPAWTLCPLLLGGSGHLQQLVLGQACVPDVHRAHLGELAHRLPVSRHRCTRRRPRVPLEKPLLRARSRRSPRVASRRTRRGPAGSRRSRSGRRAAPARVMPEHTEFDRCASPQSWTVRPDHQGGREVGGHDLVGGAMVKMAATPSSAHAAPAGVFFAGVLLEQTHRIPAAAAGTHSNGSTEESASVPPRQPPALLGLGWLICARQPVPLLRFAIPSVGSPRTGTRGRRSRPWRRSRSCKDVDPAAAPLAHRMRLGVGHHSLFRFQGMSWLHPQS